MSVSPPRSTSRGRGVQSTGRGGAGNFRSPSRGREGTGPEDYSDTRGREPIPAGDPNAIISTGRGGRGNIRSPSRDAPRGDNGSVEGSPLPSELRGRGYDRELISAIDSANDTGVHSFGRGGAGNKTGSPRPNSTSRSRSREPAHTTGRGGTGNMVIGGPTEKDIEELDESERASHLHAAGVHSVGRGGFANLTHGEVPHLEAPVNPHGADHPHGTHTHEYESSGRGGSGNISREHSREPGPKNKIGRSGLIGLLRGRGPKGADHGTEGEFLTTDVDTRQEVQ
ncbi:hypothetical protein BJV74DRAFT_828860 [Russula compacta]|nr:hypothetical protein BJV74DRAFT_828860 [Russula compacta]